MDELLGDRGGADGREATRAHRPRRGRSRRGGPDADFDALGYTATFLLPLVQAPPRAVWGKTKAAKWLNAEKVLGAPRLSGTPIPARSCSATCARSGPAASKDVRAWCYRTGLREVIDGLRPQLRVYSHRGRRRALRRRGRALPRSRDARARAVSARVRQRGAWLRRSQHGSCRPLRESARTGRAPFWWTGSGRGRGASTATGRAPRSRSVAWRKLTRAERQRGRGGSRGAARVGGPGGRGPSGSVRVASRTVDATVYTDAASPTPPARPSSCSPTRASRRERVEVPLGLPAPH